MPTVLCVSGGSLYTRLPLLKSAGYDVLTATNECASLAVGRLPSVDAVILDSRSSIPNLLALATELKCERPSLPILLVTDAGVEDAPEPSSAFDRIISRLDGPAILLAALRELMVGVTSISVPTKRSAGETRNQAKKPRERMAETRFNLRRLRERLST
jgi:DNA-binding response OmpR family regulator